MLNHLSLAYLLKSCAGHTVNDEHSCTDMTSEWHHIMYKILPGFPCDFSHEIKSGVESQGTRLQSSSSCISPSFFYAGILKHGLSTGKAYLTDIAESKDRQSVLGMYNAITSLGFIFGPLIGGYLADWDPTFQLSLVFGATIFMLNFILVVAVVPPLQQKESTKSGDKEPSMRPSMNIFKGIHWMELMDLILLQFLMTFSMIIFRSNFSVFLEFHFHVDYKTMGKVISFSAVASAIASATVGRISKLYSNHQTQLIHFTMLLAISVTAISISPSLPVSIVFLIPLSLSSSNLRICMMSLQLQRAREDEKGAIIGLSNSINSVSRMLAPTIVGLAQEQSSEMPGYVSSGLSLVAVAVMAMYQFERPKKEL